MNAPFEGVAVALQVTGAKSSEMVTLLSVVLPVLLTVIVNGIVSVGSVSSLSKPAAVVGSPAVLEIVNSGFDTID